jgi:hypothetical protein
MFSDAAGTVPVLTSDTTNGFAVTLDTNLDGSATLNDYSSETSASAVPEPSSLSLVGLALVLAGVLRLAYMRRKGVPRTD